MTVSETDRISQVNSVEPGMEKGYSFCMLRLHPLIRLARPHQYIKNVFVLMPLFFAGGFLQPELLWPALAGFVAFSLAASGVYVLNDLFDREEDRRHPEKQQRPLASGEVSVRQAGVLAAVLTGCGVVLMAVVSMKALIILAVYLAINAGYSFRLKQVPILDVVLIAIGFALRLFVGSFAAGIPLSQWIVVTTFLLALFLALAKRRDDLVIHARTGECMRIASKGYNLELLNSAITLLAGCTIVSYLQYTVSTSVTTRLGSDHVYFTTLFVVLGMLRYLQITFVDEKSGSPTQVILTDRFTQVNLLCWLLSFGVLLYT
jgi:4-hydroxybenzoate polyprenyltransferase